MNHSDHEKRLIALEEKLLFQEDTLHTLDGVITQQYDVIDKLTQRLKALEDKITMLQNDFEQQPATTDNEKPPHY